MWGYRANRRAPRDKLDSLAIFSLAATHRAFVRAPRETAASIEMDEVLSGLVATVDGASSRILDKNKTALQHLSLECLTDISVLALRMLLELCSHEELEVSQRLLHVIEPGCLCVLARLRKHQAVEGGVEFEWLAQVCPFSDRLIAILMSCHKHKNTTV